MLNNAALDDSITDYLAGKPEAVQNPYLLYQRIREAGPVYWYKSRVPFIARYADAVTLFRDNARFLTYRGKERFDLDRLSDADKACVDQISSFESLQMNEMNGETHRRVRSAAQRAFPPARVAAMAASARRAANDLLDEMAREGVSDFMKFTYRLPLTVITEFIGMPREDIDHLKEWGDDIARVKPFTSGNLPVENIRKAADSVQKTKDYIAAMVERHRANPERTPFMEALLDAQAGDRLSPEELAGSISIIIYASHEATSNMLGNGLHSLMTHRDQWDLLCAQPELGGKTVAETLRYNAPVQMMTRRACEDLQLSGVDIPRGSQPIILYGSANRDEREFALPDALDLRREKTNHLAFGHGVHVCIGSALAKLEGQIVFETLSQRFPDMRLDDTFVSQWKPHPVFRGQKALPIRLGRDRGRTDA